MSHTLPVNLPGSASRPDPYAPRQGAGRTYYFTVKGRGAFPHDMLRYDKAWAVTGIDRANDGPYLQGERTVVLATHDRAVPTIGRWESFGWQVVDRRIDKPEWLP
jgi:hypothetical protein